MRHLSIFLLFAFNIYSATDAAGNPKSCSKNHTYMFYMAENIQDTLFMYDLYDDNASCAFYTCVRARKNWLTIVDELINIDCEHIIDVHFVDGVDEKCSRDLIANLIPTDSKWNRAMGRKCWNVVEQEKRKIYGDEIVDNAMNVVKKCCLTNQTQNTQNIQNIEKTNSKENMTTTYIFALIGACLFILTASIAFGYCIAHYVGRIKIQKMKLEQQEKSFELVDQ